jgi:hypothetical protein
MIRVTHEGDLLALIVGRDDLEDGYNFVSGNDWGVQVGFNNYAQGAVCAAHEHLPRSAELAASIGESTVEVLHILRGRCELDLYHHDRLVATHLLTGGMTAVMVRGGHGLRMLEPTKILEAKQGPYVSREIDKRLIDVQRR